jgi:RNA polymerase sigma-70 factor (sigma-E family)
MRVDQEVRAMGPMPDEAAFAEFVAARSSALMRTAYLLTRDHHLAEDLVQTALFKAAMAWERIEGEPEPYVRRILYTENVSWWRRRRRVVEAGPVRPEEPAGAGTDVDLHVALERALGQLTAKQRTVLVLRYYEDLTEADAARVLGVGVGTVKSTHRRALLRLRRLAPHLGELIGVTHE